jgi:hypothetical protein
VVEELDQLQVDDPEAPALLTRALSDGTYLAQTAAAFNAVRFARVGKLTPGLLEQLGKRARLHPSFDLDEMSLLAVKEHELRALTPDRRLELYDELQQSPEFSRALLIWWNYDLPDHMLEYWKQHPAYQRTGKLFNQSASGIYHTRLLKEKFTDREKYADSLLDRLQDGYRKLDAGVKDTDEDRYIEELLALTQRLIDLGDVSVRRILARPHLLEMAAQPSRADDNALGFVQALDVLRAVGGPQAAQGLQLVTPGADHRGNQRVAERAAWLAAGVRYPFKYRVIFGWWR